MEHRSRRLDTGAATAVVLVAGLLVAVMLTSPATAKGDVSCGDVLTEDTVLERNVGPCPDGGLVIGADDITLDLNGRRVFGTEEPGDGPGVLIDDRTGVTVTNGKVSLFDAGVAIMGGSRNTVSGIQAVNNVGSGGTDFGDGIAVGNSSDNDIVGNRLTDNGPFSGVGVFGGGSSGNTIDNNRIVGNDAVDVNAPDHGDPSGTQQTDGVRLEPLTSENTVTNNAVRGSGLDGIALFRRSTDNVVRGNDVRGNGLHDKLHRKGSGIILFNEADRNVVEDNTVIGNAANGIVLRGAVTFPGVTIPGARDNRVLDNTTRGNGVLDEPETEFYDLRDDNVDPPCDDNEWRGNTFKTFNQDCVTG